MMDQRPQQNRQIPNGKFGGRNRPPNRPSFWRYLIWMLLIWVVATYFFQQFSHEDRATLSYTEFKKQVKGENVTEVVFKGNQINGKFKNKYQVVSQDGKDSTAYSAFVSEKPILNDPELMNLLESNQVTIKAEEEGQSWLRIFLISFLPWILIIGFFVYMSRRMQGRSQGMMGGGLFNIGRSKAKRYQKSSGTVTYEDVAGLENAKKRPAGNCGILARAG